MKETIRISLLVATVLILLGVALALSIVPWDSYTSEIRNTEVITDDYIYIRDRENHVYILLTDNGDGTDRAELVYLP